MTSMRMLPLLACLAACDVPLPGADEAPAPAPERAVAVPAILARYAECHADCLARPMSATNRETCKLDCEGVAVATREQLLGVAPDERFTAALADLRGCIHACHEDPELRETDRATCVLTCEGAAGVAATDVPAAAPSR